MVKKFLSGLKKRFDAPTEEAATAEYVELSPDQHGNFERKVIVRPYILEDFSDVKQIVSSLREGYTIALINISPLKEKDLVELKRAINKLKKTIDAVEGDIAGFGDDYIVVAPSFAEIYRSTAVSEPDAE